MGDLTVLLRAVSNGDKCASEDLLPVVYQELRSLAAAYMNQERAGHTLQPTALVHEAWLRLVGGESCEWENRKHFFSAAAEAMRRILVDSARRKLARKHGGSLQRLDLAELDLAEGGPEEMVLALNDALERMKKHEPDIAQIVMLKFFGGLSQEEIADLTGCSARTVKRQWRYAKAWLFRQMHLSL